MLHRHQTVVAVEPAGPLVFFRMSILVVGPIIAVTAVLLIHVSNLRRRSGLCVLLCSDCSEAERSEQQPHPVQHFNSERNTGQSMGLPGGVRENAPSLPVEK